MTLADVPRLGRACPSIGPDGIHCLHRAGHDGPHHGNVEVLGEPRVIDMVSGIGQPSRSWRTIAWDSEA